MMGRFRTPGRMEEDEENLRQLSLEGRSGQLHVSHS